MVRGGLPLRHAVSGLIVMGVLLATLISVAAFFSVRQLVSQAALVDRTNVVAAGLERLLSAVTGIQNGGRGYVITGDTAFLAPYHAGRSSLVADTTELRSLIVDPDQRAALDRVIPLIEEQRVRVDRLIMYRRTRGFAAAKQFVTAGGVQAVTDSIRAQVADMKARQANLLGRRQEQSAQTRRIIALSALLALVLTAGLALAGAVVSSRLIHQRDHALHERERFFQTSLDMLCVCNKDGYFVDVNEAWRSVLGYTPQQMRASPFLDFVHPDDRDKTVEEFGKLLAGEDSLLFENRYRTANGEYLRILWSSTFDDSAGVIYGAARDVTELKRAQEEVRQLAGLLPICASCKKIRDDSGYWNQIESYIRSHSQAEFSHGICPDCAKRLYGEFLDDPALA